MNDDILLAKLASIDRCLQRIKKVSDNKPESVENIDIQDIVVLNLQRAIQATIDMATWYISNHHLGLPDSLKAHFTLLREEGVINRELCERLEAMVGFRNIAVHQYQQLNLEILKNILTSRLGDLEAFVVAIKSHVRDV